MRPHPLPMCAVCGKPVDELVMERDPVCDVQIYTARCHGEIEESRLSKRDVIDATRIEFTLAFDTKALAAPLGALPDGGR